MRSNQLSYIAMVKFTNAACSAGKHLQAKFFTSFTHTCEQLFTMAERSCYMVNFTEIVNTNYLIGRNRSQVPHLHAISLVHIGLL